MKLRDFPLLTDENIIPEVIAYLRLVGFDVIDVTENGWEGQLDTNLIAIAHSEGRVVATHDADFGSLAVQQNQPLIGIFYIRPGHFDGMITIDTINHVLLQDPDLEPPFLLVAKRGADRINIRVRTLLP